MIWTWAETATPDTMTVQCIMSFRRAFDVSDVLRIGAEMRIFRTAAAVGQARFDGPNHYSLSADWPYLAFTAFDAPIVIQGCDLADFMRHCGYSPFQAAGVESYFGDDEMRSSLLPGAPERSQRRQPIRRLIDTRPLRGILVGEDPIGLHPSVQLLTSSGLVPAATHFWVNPGSAERWLGELADGTRFIGGERAVRQWLVEQDQTIYPDLHIALNAGV